MKTQPKTTKKKLKKNYNEAVQNNLRLNCSRAKLFMAVQLLKEKIQSRPALNMKKCKLMPRKVSIRATLPCSASHKCVQLRNALISHNWKDASLLLLSMIINGHDSMFGRTIWKAFFLILQNSPTADYTRMEQFIQLCQQSGRGTILDTLYLQ